MSENVFESWANARRVGAKPLSEKSIHLYRARWLGFEKWLIGQGLSVASATPDVLQRFLSSRSVRAHQGTSPSPVTMSRYFSVIAQIYQHALLLSMVPSNPAGDVVLPYKEAAQGIVLPFPWVNHLRQAINYHPADFNQTRDALVVHLCLCEAFSVAEICNLRISHVLTSYEGLPESNQAQVHIRIHGPRIAQMRTRVLQAQGARLVLLWLGLLNSMGVQDSTEHLLRSHPLKKNLTSKTLYLICAAHVTAGLKSMGVQDMPYHVGPNALRNSCIVDWLNNGVGVHEVCARAGLTGPTRLSRIAHAVIAD